MPVKAFSTLKSPQIIIVTITGMPCTHDGRVLLFYEACDYPSW